MTTRILDGLTFRVHSPSCYELLSVREDIEGGKVLITYEPGDNGAPRPYWYIHYRSPGVNLSRAFRTRDAAVAMIADRRGM